MKKIQKEIVRKEYVNVFVANDGTEFTDENECKQYDESAKGVLFAKHNARIIKKSDEYSLFGFGSEDNVIDVVKFENESDLDLTLQCYLLENPHLKNEENKERVQKTISRMKKALLEKDFVFIGRGYDEDGYWFEGTRNEHIAVLQRIGEPEDESE